MSQVIAIKFGQQTQTDISLDDSENAKILQRLERERLELIKSTNYLEALYARLLIIRAESPAV
ncbi:MULTISPECIES: hypothetical protein [unclassified Rhizobium]|uniref:hypothetical protein n=1 Tax=unclassified Rhizobium TaxID=2613769 RepID=UPI000EA97C71|nr:MULTISPECIES: hypothetical protein [unclassified Rhizobium]AYG70062.1 hypothetical protein CCGE531_28845 [Rhizobium sp. CCGE531]AYG76437.1 hypothetical protein CCGE532_28320 [Rhizobium sp. CCGE532]